MTAADLSLVGRGLYSPSEAARLARVPVRRLRRWTNGYWFQHRGVRQWSDPLVGLNLGKVGEAPVLDFMDLMEVRFLNAFRDLGVSWQTIRLARERAMEVFGTTHPFSSNRFVTDGRHILAELRGSAGDKRALNLVRDQWEMPALLFNSLRIGLRYEGSSHPRWWSPMGPDRLVLLHPGRSFGAPIVSEGCVRTRILAGGYRAEQSFEAVAQWYCISERAVRDAVEYEESLPKAA